MKSVESPGGNTLKKHEFGISPRNWKLKTLPGDNQDWTVEMSQPDGETWEIRCFAHRRDAKAYVAEMEGLLAALGGTF